MWAYKYIEKKGKHKKFSGIFILNKEKNMEPWETYSWFNFKEKNCIICWNLLGGPNAVNEL